MNTTLTPPASQKTFNLQRIEKTLNPKKMVLLGQFQIARRITQAIVCHPEDAYALCKRLVESAITLECDRNMYRAREIREGFLLGLLEAVVALDKNCTTDDEMDNQFKSLFPLTIYLLIFKADGSNWEVKSPRMMQRLERAIAKFCSGSGRDRLYRIGQIVSIVNAMKLSHGHFCGGWRHDMARCFTVGLFNCDFVQVQLDIMVNHWKSLDGGHIPAGCICV